MAKNTKETDLVTKPQAENQRPVPVTITNEPANVDYDAQRRYEQEVKEANKHQEEVRKDNAVVRNRPVIVLGPQGQDQEQLYRVQYLENQEVEAVRKHEIKNWDFDKNEAKGELIQDNPVK